MIVGAAVVPSAPLLVDGVSARLPEGVEAVAAALGAVLGALPPHELAVLVAADGGAVHADAVADLAGIGRADLRRPLAVDRAAAESVAALLERPPVGGPLPLGLTVLGLLYTAAREPAPVVPLAVPAGADPQVLLALGRGLAPAVGDRRTVVLAAGDLSAGVSERGPLGLVEGARAWDDELVDVVAGGRLDRVARMGPAEAQRVGAVGWAPLVVLAGTAAAARIGSVVRSYAAPRGVGYLVARVG